ncbi:MAG: carboxylating nicotinate-nucleotide diphosphorylase [Gammaproteobacteria bacterium]|jgi:nicotinate-nucleotide pyrophosphorylase (carboxylating)|nr:carboxylating nicotinate-nucleotide diphosphorylase [Gammaproteobacteria bacterium]
MKKLNDLPDDITETVSAALREDIGSGDLTAELIPADASSRAEVVCRQEAVLCGTAWFDEVFRQLDETVEVKWLVEDSGSINADQIVCQIQGPTRTLLSGERSALNFLQLLSGTATLTRGYVQQLGDSKTRLLDTRKTIPGLRTAQKYAVSCGGGKNHRIGLFDAILIKENHILAAGSIEKAVTQAKLSSTAVEVEVENIEELKQAISAGADSILLDNFNLDSMHKAVQLNNGRALLEVSGGVEIDKLKAIAESGVDYISVGALTKHVHAVDFSMRIL